VTSAVAAADEPTADPQEVLARVFGFGAFRGLQGDVVRHVIDGGDALVLMPTGGGKSLCYQLPALCRPGLAVVVSPLIALMDDQVAALRQLGVRAAAMHSELDPVDAQLVARDLGTGRLDLLYVSPERLLSGGLIERLQRQRLSLIAIDEAHCVSQWGHEFRPEYRGLALLPERFPGVPRIALTATADQRTRDDILTALGMTGARVFTASFHRPNLYLTAEPKIGEMEQLRRFLRRHERACGIVYCGSRAKTERVAERLASHGLAAVAFHAGLDPQDKKAALRRFRAGEAMVMVATIAFGMGIDRPDVRFVAHLDMPDSPESFYQQIGRAGRDGERAETLLLHGGEDVARARHWLALSGAPEAQKAVMRTRLEQMIQLTETPSCRTRALLACFGETLDAPCGHCDRCARPPALFDGTTEAQKVLSAVYRTGQMFGAVHIAKVLRGERTDQVVRHKHDSLPTFGVGQDRGEGFWRGVMRQLIALGALEIKPRDDGGGLALVADKARGILRGETRVELGVDAAEPVRAARRERGTAADAPPLPAGAEALFERLRAWRTAEARAQGVPPYVIFHDSVLRAIAIARPMDDAALGAIPGVGTTKRGRYGAALLGLIVDAAAD
jgi:ATP-dependent DNA helicase RecQ